MNQDRIRDFFDAWSLYDQVLDRNFMFHNEIYRDVANVVASAFQPGRFTLLDLGCGSARHLSAALRGCAPARYVGYDLSEVALGHARNNLAPLGCRTDLRQADLLDGLRPGNEAFDLVFSSFALHHLPTAGKERFVQLAHDKLNPGGFLLLVDTARRPDEDRPTHLDRYCDWVQSNWRGLSEAGLNYIEEHIRGNDFPETSATLHAMAAKAGFIRVTDLNEFKWHHTWLFEKAGKPSSRVSLPPA